MTAAEVSEALGLSNLKSRTWAIFKTSAKQGTGLDEAMDWCVTSMYLFTVALMGSAELGSPLSYGLVLKPLFTLPLRFVCMALEGLGYSH